MNNHQGNLMTAEQQEVYTDEGGNSYTLNDRGQKVYPVLQERYSERWLQIPMEIRSKACSLDTLTRSISTNLGRAPTPTAFNKAVQDVDQAIVELEQLRIQLQSYKEQLDARNNDEPTA